MLAQNQQLFFVWFSIGYYDNLGEDIFHFPQVSGNSTFVTTKKSYLVPIFLFYFFFWHRCRWDRHGHHDQVFAIVVVFTVFHRVVVVFVVVVGSMSSWSLCSLALCRCICPIQLKCRPGRRRRYWIRHVCGCVVHSVVVVFGFVMLIVVVVVLTAVHGWWWPWSWSS